jgi:hypothetical protein
LCDRHLIVAAYFDLGAQLSQILDQVVGKRIVIIENEDQRSLLPISAYNGIRFGLVCGLSASAGGHPTRVFARVVILA